MCSARFEAFKVFLVEDSPIVLERLEAMLGTITGAATVGHASRAEEAIHGILDTRPDAVVLDINLSQGSGFDVLRAVRAQAPAIDVYMLTNFTADAYRRLAERLGVRGFFDKSTEFDDVRAVLSARANEKMH